MPARHRADCDALNQAARLLIDEITLGMRAAERAPDRAAKARIERALDERRRLLADVQARVRMMKCKPARSGTFLGAAHKALAAVRPDAAHAEVEREEQQLREALRRWMRREDISPETRDFFCAALSRLVTGEAPAAPAKQLEVA